MKKIPYWILAAGMLLMAGLGGCSITNIKEDGKEALEYTVVKDEDIPEELRNLIEQKKEREFQLTYQSDNCLYLLKGYGRQKTGGYSIQVEDVSMSESGVFFKTTLMGPKSEESQSQEPSYPYIAVKIQYQDQPVQFQ